MDARTSGEEALGHAMPAGMVSARKKLHAVPYFGITGDGNKDSGLFPIEDKGAPTERTAAAANDLLAVLSARERESSV